MKPLNRSCIPLYPSLCLPADEIGYLTQLPMPPLMVGTNVWLGSNQILMRSAYSIRSIHFPLPLWDFLQVVCLSSLAYKLSLQLGCDSVINQNTLNARHIGVEKSGKTRNKASFTTWGSNSLKNVPSGLTHSNTLCFVLPDMTWWRRGEGHWGYWVKSRFSHA